jgi:hypothetical protein
MSKPMARIERMLSVRLQKTARSGGGMGSSVAAASEARSTTRTLDCPAPMARFLAALAWCAASAVVLATAGCGAGLVVGAASANSGGNAAAGAAPALSVPAVLPLAPAPGDRRTVVVANADFGGASVVVQLRAGDVVVDQPEATASAQGGATQVAFTLATAAILAAVGDPTAADVPASLRVLVGGREIAPPAGLVLARQPAAALVLPPGVTQQFLSPLGDRVRLRVSGLRAVAEADLQVLVATPDPAAAGATVVRPCTDVRFEAGSGVEPEISALAPGNSFPTRLTLFVRDAVAGQSTAVVDAYYRPDIAVALPGQGATTGGSLVTLIGTALVPHGPAGANGSAPLDFDAVKLRFRKGARSLDLPRADLRVAESSVDRLVFTIPPAPDGRPGQVDIILRVQLDGAFAEIVAGQVFLFANPRPFFGPRGVVLDRLPVAVAPIPLDQAPAVTAAPDFAALTDQGGVGFVQLLLAQQNGMFQPFAAPVRIGDPAVIAERGPRDLCVGDFDADGVPDLFVVNAGAIDAVHHILLGQQAPMPPLGAVSRVTTSGGMVTGRAATIDGDGVPDVVLLPGIGATAGQRPVLLLARPLGPGQPAFAAPVDVPVRAYAYDGLAVADFDSDGVQDVAVASGVEGKLDVAFGVGDGTFAEVSTLDFSVPGYAFHPDSPIVGLHGCGDGQPQSLALVFSGLLSSFGGGPTPPCVVRVRQSSLREFDPVAAADVLLLPTEPIGRSLAADFDQSPPLELLVAMRDEPLLVSLGLLRLGTDAFEPLTGAIEGGSESPRQIRAVVYDRAFPATATSPEKKAVFVVHEADIDGAREKRLSTRLVIDAPVGQPRLLSADAGGQVGFRIEAVVAGDFHPTSLALQGARDLALARTVASAPTDAIVLVANDGFGGLPALGNRCDVPGLLPRSLTLAPSVVGGIDRLAFLDRQSRVGTWLHDPTGPSVQPVEAMTPPLRQLLADPALAAAPLADGSRMVRADVDGDGIDDLVALLLFDVPDPGEGKGALALLRGKAAVGAGEFPFHVPTALVPVHGRSSDLAVGDFTRNGPGPVQRLEIAIAVPFGIGTDGNHVRFHRYAAGATPAADTLVPAAAASGPQALLAGSNPTRLAAADLDGDGSTDLLVAGAGDGALRLYRNAAQPAATAVDVQITAFAEALASPWPTGAGTPTALLLSDVNGDGDDDALVSCEADVGGVRSTSVGLYLGTGDGGFTGPRFLSPTRVGDRDGTLHGDVGDWNRDGLPDLLLGWATSGSADFNLRILFGGTR